MTVGCHTLRTSPTIYACELEICPQCHQPLREAHYVNGRKTAQTMMPVLTIGYRPKVCACRVFESAGGMALCGMATDLAEA